MSKSKTRSVAAIGNSRVIPAQAGIQWLSNVVMPLTRSTLARLAPSPRVRGEGWGEGTLRTTNE
jgi:hypothetical protein